MTTITIPKHVLDKDLVLIPREEYEALTTGRQPRRAYKEVRMTKAQKRELTAAQRDYARGAVVTLDVLRRDLARRHSR